MNLRLALMAAIVVVSGCTTSGLNRGGPASGGGTASGSASIIGAMNGGLVGGPVGADLGADDRRKALEAEYRALEYTQAGQKVTWRTGRDDVFGEVVAAAPYRVGSQDCRQYTQTVYSGGSNRSARGTACRNSDGSWTPLT